MLKYINLTIAPEQTNYLFMKTSFIGRIPTWKCAPEFLESILELMLNSNSNAVSLNCLINLECNIECHGSILNFSTVLDIFKRFGVHLVFHSPTIQDLLNPNQPCVYSMFNLNCFLRLLKCEIINSGFNVHEIQKLMFCFYLMLLDVKLEGIHQDIIGYISIIFDRLDNWKDVVLLVINDLSLLINDKNSLTLLSDLCKTLYREISNPRKVFIRRQMCVIFAFGNDGQDILKGEHSETIDCQQLMRVMQSRGLIQFARDVDFEEVYPYVSIVYYMIFGSDELIANENRVIF